MSNDINLIRTAIYRIISEMLDNPDKHGIYPTSDCFDRLEGLIDALMVTPDVMQLSGSESLYGFIAWLTTNGESYEICPNCDCAVWPDLIEEFSKTNNLSEPRKQWTELLTHPKRV